MTTPSPRTRAWRWLVLVLAAAIAALALMPVPPQPAGLGWDKLNHLAAFAALALCAGFGWRSSRAARLAVLLALLAFGGAIELLQRHVPNRSGEWSDLLADGIGIGVGALFALWWLRRRTQSPQ
jgi:VanZ family protein